MGVQEMNLDVTKKLDNVSTVFRDNVFNKMRAGVENALEVATESGSTALANNCKNCLDGTDAMIKVFGSLIDCVERYSAQIKKVNEALN